MIFDKAVDKLRAESDCSMMQARKALIAFVTDPEWSDVKASHIDSAKQLMREADATDTLTLLVRVIELEKKIDRLMSWSNLD